MKKVVIMTAVALVTLTGCQSIKEHNPFKKDKAVGMVNPASEFCVKQGGKLERKKDAKGNEYAICHLPGGQVVEEWEYFRKHNQK